MHNVSQDNAARLREIRSLAAQSDARVVFYGRVDLGGKPDSFVELLVDAAGNILLKEDFYDPNFDLQLWGQRAFFPLDHVPKAPLHLDEVPQAVHEAYDAQRPVGYGGFPATEPKWAALYRDDVHLA